MSVVSDSVQRHRQPPTRLPRPWYSPGKNTGVGCHFLLQCMKVKSESEIAQSCPTFSDPTDCSLPGSSVHGIFQARVLEWGASAFSDVHHRWEDLLATITGNDVHGISSLSWQCLETIVNTMFLFLYQWFSLTWPEMFFSFSLVLQSASANPF